MWFDQTGTVTPGFPRPTPNQNIRISQEITVGTDLYSEVRATLEMSYEFLILIWLFFKKKNKQCAVTMETMILPIREGLQHFAL